MTRFFYIPAIALLFAIASFLPATAYAVSCFSSADCQQTGGTCANIDSATNLGTCTGGTINSGGVGGGNTINSGGTGGSSGGTGQLDNPLGTGASLPGLLTAILQFVVRIGAIIVVLMLVYVGFLFVTAQGSETKITAAKSALLWTVVGALILLGAEAIAQGIQATVQALSTGT